MVIRDIITLPDSKLRLVSKPIERVDDDLNRLIDDMLATMYEAPGVGLAAIQIAEPIRLLVADASPKEGPREPLALINPEIVWSSDERRIYEEGCLSIPEYYEEVERPASVRVRYRRSRRQDPGATGRRLARDRVAARNRPSQRRVVHRLSVEAEARPRGQEIRQDRAQREQGPALKIDIEALKVPEGAKLALDEWPTSTAPLYESKQDYEDALKDHSKALQKRHERLYANARHAMLIVFQGMDTAGKDGAIKHALSGVNPQGCRVASFKAPTPTELRHDFLWRGQADLPERGAMSIFNRSYYEAVLIERVHPKLLQNEGVEPPKDLDGYFNARLRAIRDFERHLREANTHVVKIFLHISKDEQRRRLLARVDDEEKNWKASMGDIEERGFWKDYMRAYEQTLAATSVADAPWFVVPADDKKNARLYVSQILIDALSALPIEMAKPDAARKKELKAIRRKLED